MHTAEKAVYERNCTQMPVTKKKKKKKKKKERKKEQTTNTYGKQRKNKPQMLMANEKWLP